MKLFRCIVLSICGIVAMSLSAVEPVDSVAILRNQLAKVEAENTALREQLSRARKVNEDFARLAGQITEVYCTQAKEYIAETYDKIDIDSLKLYDDRIASTGIVTSEVKSTRNAITKTVRIKTEIMRIDSLLYRPYDFAAVEGGIDRIEVLKSQLSPEQYEQIRNTTRRYLTRYYGAVEYFQELIEAINYELDEAMRVPESVGTCRNNAEAIFKEKEALRKGDKQQYEVVEYYIEKTPYLKERYERFREHYTVGENAWMHCEDIETEIMNIKLQ